MSPSPRHFGAKKRSNGLTREGGVRPQAKWLTTPVKGDGDKGRRSISWKDTVLAASTRSGRSSTLRKAGDVSGRLTFTQIQAFSLPVGFVLYRTFDVVFILDVTLVSYPYSKSVPTSWEDRQFDGLV